MLNDVSKHVLNPQIGFDLKHREIPSKCVNKQSVYIDVLAKVYGLLDQLSIRKIVQRVKGDCNTFLRSRYLMNEVLKRPINNASILILGCDYHYPEVILFSRVFKHVIGLDIIGAFYKDGIAKTWIDMKERGGAFKALLKAMLRRVYASLYYHYLGRMLRVLVEPQRYFVISYDGVKMPFRDESFDIVFSNAVLEHIELSQKYGELQREEGYLTIFGITIIAFQAVIFLDHFLFVTRGCTYVGSIEL